jgi:N-acetylneuraminate synthase
MTAGSSLSFNAGSTLVVAEIAQAHDGSLGTAHAYIDAVADAGADAIKFQTHIARAESTPGEPWRVQFSMQDATRYEYWQRMEFTEPQWAGLKRHADERGLAFLSSPFSTEAFELLCRTGVAGWKVASGELTNHALIEGMAGTGLPVLLSTGMSGWAEIDEAVSILKKASTPLAVMQCTSAYPCPPERIGLNLLSEIRQRYACFVGLSDHSGMIFPSIAAATLGAEVVEVHVTFSRKAFGPDVVASITCEELAELVRGVHCVSRMRNAPVDKDAEAKTASGLRALFTKSVVARTDLQAGRVLRPDDLSTKKPGTGIPASQLPLVINRKLVCDLPADALILEAHLEKI